MTSFPHILASLGILTSATICLSSCGYYVFAVSCARSFFRRPLRRNDGFTPPITVLKPLCGLDWGAYFEAAGLSSQPMLMVWHPSGTKGIAALVASEPLEVWKDYLAYHAVNGAAKVIPVPVIIATPSPAAEQSGADSTIAGDSSVQQAAAGATVKHPVKDQFYGDRSGSITDPFGYVWTIATHTEDVAPDEMQRRIATMVTNE